MTLKLYYDLMSQPCRALYIFLKANDVPFESCIVDLRQGEHLSDDYAQINRFKKVPAIDDGGFQLTESIAIFRYLVKEKNIPEHWYPNDHVAQAKVDEYLEWQHMNTRFYGSSYFLTKWLEPLLTGNENPGKIKRAEKKMITCLDNIENLWLSRGTLFIAGNTLTVADLVAACELEQPRMAGYDPTVGRPKLKEWWTRVRTELSPYYQEAHAGVEELVAEAAEKERKAKL